MSSKGYCGNGESEESVEMKNLVDCQERKATPKRPERRTNLSGKSAGGLGKLWNTRRCVSLTIQYRMCPLQTCTLH